MNYLRVLAAIFVLGFHSACADEYPACDIAETAQVQFSSDDSADVLSVIISGKPCYEATLVITIASENGAIWYRYEERFKQHVVTRWDNPLLDEDAQRLADRLTNQESFGLTSDLPIWLPKEEYYEQNYQTLEIEQARYEGLRNAKWVTYSHPIHYEGWKVIAFDQDKQDVVEVSGGGL